MDSIAITKHIRCLVTEYNIVCRNFICIIVHMDFEWDDGKNDRNITKHNISFHEAKFAFSDHRRIIVLDKKHSTLEKRYFCIGKTRSGNVATVRFTIRNGHIRIIGAGYWREGKKLYEQS